MFDERQIQNIIKDSNSTNCYGVQRFFCYWQKLEEEMKLMKCTKLKPYGIMQFVRSGRIAVTKSEMKISALLKEFNQKS